MRNGSQSAVAARTTGIAIVVAGRTTGATCSIDLSVRTSPHQRGDTKNAWLRLPARYSGTQRERKRCFGSLNVVKHRLRGSPNLLFIGYPEIKPPGRKAGRTPRLVPSLRMGRASPPLPHAPSCVIRYKVLTGYYICLLLNVMSSCNGVKESLMVM